MMGVAVQPLSYTRIAMILHWVIALLVIFMIGLGYYMVDVPRQTPARGALFNLHKSIGLLVLALMMIRVIWRFTHRPPPLPAHVAPWNRALAGTTHLALYLVLIAQPILGYVASTFGKYGVAFFGIPLPKWGADDPSIREPFLSAHHTVAVLLLVLIALHLAGVVWHLVSDRDDIFFRMWPATRRGLRSRNVIGDAAQR